MIYDKEQDVSRSAQGCESRSVNVGISIATRVRSRADRADVSGGLEFGKSSGIEKSSYLE